LQTKNECNKVDLGIDISIVFSVVALLYKMLKTKRPTYSMSYQPSHLAQAARVAASNGLSLEKSRQSRFSVAALWSMAAENDAEVEDELTKCIHLLTKLRGN
jgi:hypothetical protein